MEYQSLYLLAADVILLLHTLFVAFVVLGVLLIFVGKFLRWHWVRNPWFRLAHLAAIGVVVAESWAGVICPFTVWEMALRAKAGETVYTGSFISHWLEMLLYYQAPAWVFRLVYSAFGLLVLASWYWVRPRSFGRRRV
ncbi:DUF2784 domain-containing protein [Microbulbifer rhizosphaerae]|uniref:DUF2784 domain-containing protein n=1 Tax=Microbulbifer rhizosphaerae TaxID=1562603 RepID=A0A7W4WB90_9GAMM|nr:DUF2784 domain-containing protein [Microbulbifer rhizosphaerae]MBB3060503.1 hypothetical protein [Microbulbifer rhizosphaerae]